MTLLKMTKKRFYIFVFLCSAVAAAMTIFNFIDSIQQNDNPKILGRGIQLLLSTIAMIFSFYCFKGETKTK